MHYSFLYLIVISFFITLCCDDVKEESNISECRQLTILVEDCMGLHRGALNYIDSCGSLDLEQAKKYLTCEELLDYFGIGLIPETR